MSISYTLSLIRCFIPSLIFCFRYLPVKQAVKLPILVFKAHLVDFGGKVRIECKHIEFGMIRLGQFAVRSYPDTGIHWSNKGEIVFKGKCLIGSNSHIVCGPQGHIEFGDDFKTTSTMRLVSMCSITFGKSTRVGWETTIMDTSFHPLYDMKRECFKRAYGPIKIGDYNWFGTRCLVMHSVETPERCIFGATTVVTRGGKYEPFCVHGGSPVHVLSRDVMRVYGQDIITDYSLLP